MADARADLDGLLADTDLRGILGREKYNEAAGNFAAVVAKCEADLEASRAAQSPPCEVFGHLWSNEWGHAERREWLERAVREVVVRKGREPLAERVEVELRSR